MTDSHEYRLKLATGFLNEASQDVILKRWHSAMDNAQMAVESAAKATLALIGPVGRTHHPAPLLREACARSYFSSPTHEDVLRLAEIAERLGLDVHIRTDYGDEAIGLTPWELFDEDDAQKAFAMAQEALNLTHRISHSIAEGKNQKED